MEDKKQPKKYYVVCRGYQPGIYSSWGQAKANIKDWPNPFYRGFPTMEEAEDFYNSHRHEGRYIPKKDKQKNVDEFVFHPATEPAQDSQPTKDDAEGGSLKETVLAKIAKQQEQQQKAEAERQQKEAEEKAWAKRILFGDNTQLEELVDIYEKVSMLNRRSLMSYARYLTTDQAQKLF